MNHRLLWLGFLGLIGWQSGCTATPGSELFTPQTDQGAIVVTTTQFDNLRMHVADHLQETTLLAGAVMNIDETAEGYLVLAEWLPYPQDQPEEGPQPLDSDDHRYFLFQLAAKPEKEFETVHGNTFLLEGTVAGTRSKAVYLFGVRENLLYVNAQCVHLWETGEDTLSSSPGDAEYPPTRHRTICVE